MPEEWVSILGRAGRDGLECQALGKIRVEGLREEEDAIGASEFGRLRGEPLATATGRGGHLAPEIQSSTTAVGPAQASEGAPVSNSPVASDSTPWIRHPAPHHHANGTNAARHQGGSVEREVYG